jgi:hypothetical protein
MGTRRDLNVIPVGDRELLLTVGGGEAIHLTRAAGDDEVALAAVPDHYLDDLTAAFDRDALEDPRWLETTLCGRQWILMASDEDGEDDEAVFVPTCRRCLSIMDKLFPAPKRDERFEMIVQVITDMVAEHGFAEMWDVPGDQQTALRNAVRTAVRKRTGHGMETLAQGTMVVFACEPIAEVGRMERAREAAEAVSNLIKGEAAATLPTPWRLSWDTWAAG